MALIQTLTISTTTFERTKEKFDGFRQTVLNFWSLATPARKINETRPTIQHKAVVKLSNIVDSTYTDIVNLSPTKKSQVKTMMLKQQCKAV